MQEEPGSKKNDYLKSLIEVLPNKPGVYQYFDKSADMIYVGKAKDLKKRVSSYFTRTNYENNKLRLLVQNIADIKHIVVENESDAFLLENNLIKKYQPRYNVQLKDDKTFPWICVKNEAFPRIFSTRTLKDDGSVYYGPYTSGLMVKTIIDLIRQLFPLRSCKHNLTASAISANKFKVCLEYHIGNCLAPCIGVQKADNYDDSINQIHHILKGNINQVSLYLKGLMKSYSDSFDYERAQMIKEKIQLLKRYQSRSTIVNPRISNIDVYTILEEDNYAFVNYIKVINGAIIQAHNLEIRKQLDEQKDDLLPMAIVEIRNKISSNAKEILLPFPIDLGMPHIKQTVPVRGDKKKLLDLSIRNARHYQMEQRKQREALSAESKYERILQKIKEDLRLTAIPVHIECFDNSNIQGKEPVASCVVFRNTRPSKKEYRHFHIKTVTGANDYASMEEVITRRYARLLKEERDLPQLIVIDGGKGQLSAAVNSLEKLGLRGKIAVVGIAKKLEELYFPDDSVPLYIDKNSETLKALQNLRNEAHRFGITFHRNQRSKKMTLSVLDQIEGVGEQTKQKLLTRYHSIENILKEDPENLYREIGKQRAGKILAYLSGQKKSGK